MILACEYYNEREGGRGGEGERERDRSYKRKEEVEIPLHLCGEGGESVF